MRDTLLNNLINFDKPLPLIQAKLKNYQWDSNTEFVLITRAHVRTVLNRFLIQQLKAHEVETWANLIEGRDDIGFETGFETLIKEAIHTLANPLLTQALTPQYAKMIIARL